MGFEIFETTQFRRDVKKVKKRNKDIRKLKEIVLLLVSEHNLPFKIRDHNLIGNWFGCRECHIEPDWLLIYKKDLEKNLLTLVRTGSHADLF